MTSRRRIGLVLALAGLALAITLALLAQRALRSAAREAELQQQFVAEALFDEMEAELTALIEVEEGRPFDHWRPTVVEAGTRVAPSPLAEIPSGPVDGYFQIDPDGTVSSPHPLTEPLASLRPRLAERFDGWGGRAPGPRSVEVVVPTPRPAAAPKPTPKPTPAPAPNPPPIQTANLDLFEVQQTTNTAAIQRKGRTEQVQSANPTQLGNFVQQQAVAPLPAPEPTAAPVPADPEPVPIDPEPPPRTAPQRVTVDVPIDQVVDVEVSPLRGRTDADGRWLVRTVRIGEQTWVQGMHLDEDALQATLEAVIADLGDAAALHWSSAPGEAGIPHAFAEPFDGLHAHLTLAPIEGASTWAWIAGLSLLTGLFAFLGLAAAWQTSTRSLALAQERSDFVSAVTHELRSPLTSIRMYAEMLQSGLVADPTQQAEYYGVIKEEAERLSRLVEDVLTFSRLERGATAVVGGRAGLGEVLGQIDAVLGPVLARSGHTLEVDITPEVSDLPVAADAVAQVLTNLVDNGAKFSPEGTVVSVRASLVGNTLTLAVRDRGPGAEPEVRRRMFAPFFRGERELTRNTRGTGIGLALVAGIVEELGGEVEATNHPDGGLEVTVRLPTS